MTITEVADIIGRIADGFEESCKRCLWDNQGVVYLCVTEQLYSGLDGDGNYLTPNYDDDPFFNEPGFWHNRAEDYKAWKRSITPPKMSKELGLDARPDNVPNLFIDGTFYSQINTRQIEYGLEIDPGSGKGVEIVEKYGDQILSLTPTAITYFNDSVLLPWIDNFFQSCGYR